MERKKNRDLLGSSLPILKVGKLKAFSNLPEVQ